ncbi:hypothetical protein HGP17_11580 [Rhizobium sp. P38BS-XIX]|uniref:hypothetical protein n=1 Tax=Rhizobium sp. P38BS-XIX TaxID=2726740 RepID=UPI0014570B19|nr:hypothetical protein [Rhizobium sp. P38BS-XIX]NLR97459.1 hypothetical protein [Rhizobium sp. P38BS-XIX]
MKHDGLVLNLLRKEVLGSLRSLRRSDLAWLILGGSAVMAYAIADAVVALHAAAPLLRSSPSLWLAGLSAAALLLGVFTGYGTTRLALSRAYAPFMKALPISNRERRRMAVLAAAKTGVWFGAIVACVAGMGCVPLAEPYAFAWAFVAAALFAAGFAPAITAQMRVFNRQPAGEATTTDHESGLHRTRLTLACFDRARPTWSGAWAWNLRAGIVRPSRRIAAAGLMIGLAVLIAVVGGLIHHQAAPGAIVGLAGGLATFMFALRYHPLGSPVLRTAPIGFVRAWLRLLWLPLQLSAAFFALPAGAALAAEPSSLSVVAASGLWLLMLNGAYAVFAAYFMSTPLIAAFSFVAAIIYAAYESSEYGRTVVLGFVALVVWLLHRTRRRFYHG